jgi:hypothetical protein
MRRRKKRCLDEDISLLGAETAALVLRRFMRTGIGDKETRLRLAEAGMESTNPGEAEAMRRYRDAILAGKTIRYKTVEVRIIDTDELAAAVDAAFDEGMTDG